MPIVKLQAAVVHAEKTEVEIGARLYFPAQIVGMSEAPLGEILDAVQRVVASIDGPIVGDAQHLAEARATAYVGRQEAALPRHLLERFVIRGDVEYRHALDAKDRVIGDGAVVGDDVELWRSQFPPRLRHFAVGHIAVMDDVAIFLPLRPFAFEIKRIAGREQARTSHDLRC